MVARTLDSSNQGIVWDKFHIYQAHRSHSPYIRIGKKRRQPRRLEIQNHRNPLKQALHFQELLESGQADSQTELAHLIGTPRSTISAHLRLLDLDQEVQDFALSLDDADERLIGLTKARLRPLVGKDRCAQKRAFRRLMEAS